MPTKNTPGQCKFLIKRLERLLSRIAKALAEKGANFQLSEFKKETFSLLKQLEESTTYLIDHPTEDSQPDDLITTFTGIDNLDDLVSDYRRLLKRNKSATDATYSATNSAQSDNQNASSLQTALSNQSALIEFSANLSAVTSTQQQQPAFSVAKMSTSVENHQILPNNQQQQATIFPQSNSFAALPFPLTFTPQTHINTAVYTAPISTSTSTPKYTEITTTED